MASSAHKQPHHLPVPALYGGATAAPPPTPSGLPGGNHPSTSDDTTVDLLTRLFHRLPPNLSLPSRCSQSPPPPTTATPLPSLSFSSSSAANLLSASHMGLFQLTEHGIPSQLARSAESESLALFDLSPEQKESYFQRDHWPLGYEAGDDSELGESFCLDSFCSTESSPADLGLASLRQFTREMEGLGLRVVEGLFGFENPIKDDPTRTCSLLWISKSKDKGKGGLSDHVSSGGFYPFVVGLHYQIRCGQKYTMLTDSGRVSVSPEVDSVMVSVGDIAQVWSNGRLKKVRGRPIPIPIPMPSSSLFENNDSSDDVHHLTTISLLITLPLDSTVTVSPQLLTTTNEGKSIHVNEKPSEAIHILEDEGEDQEEESLTGEKILFTSFPFEDYAWRVYHERLSLRDPLDRYRIR